MEERRFQLGDSGVCLISDNIPFCLSMSQTMCYKTKYASQHFADLDILRIKKKSKRSRIPIRSYLCECGSWHLTSKDDSLHDKIAFLSKEIDRLTNENNKLTTTQSNDYDLKIKIDEKVLFLTKEVSRKNKIIAQLRLDNADLIGKLVSLQKKTGVI